MGVRRLSSDKIATTFSILLKSISLFSGFTSCVVVFTFSASISFSTEGFLIVSIVIGAQLKKDINIININIFFKNTINSKKLFKKYYIQTKYHKYTDHDFDKKKDEILQIIKNRKAISLISDSGSPLISDPGNQLVNFLYRNNIKIFSIPGPSALISGIQLSGFLNKKFFSFLGFLPKKL